MAVLEVRNLTKTYKRKGGSIIRAAYDVSFEVNSGEIVGFLGPNGAGKSTVIKMITGMASPDSGEIYILGKNAIKERAEAMKYVGGVIESPDMYSLWSGYENLKYLLSLYPREEGMTAAQYKEEKERRINEVLEIVGMTERKNDAIRKYSLGMKQRLGIAQALLNKPKLLILDEPANGLDPAGIRDIRDLLKKLAHEFDMAILVSSHQLAEMQLMCDRALIIKNGTIVAAKSLVELDFHREQSTIVIMKTNKPEEAKNILKEKYNIEASLAGINQLEFSTSLFTSELTRELVLAGIDIFGVTTKEQTLEDVFMDVTGGKF